MVFHLTPDCIAFDAQTQRERGPIALHLGLFRNSIQKETISEGRKRLTGKAVFF